MKLWDQFTNAFKPKQELVELPELLQEWLHDNFETPPPGSTIGPGGSDMDSAWPLFDRKEYASAYPLFVDAVAKGLEEPDRSIAYYSIGYIALHNHEDVAEAIDNFISCLKLNRRMINKACQAAANLQFIYESAGRDSEATLLKDFVVKNDPKAKWAYPSGYRDKVHLLTQQYTNNVVSESL